MLADCATALAAGRSHQAHSKDVAEPHRGYLTGQAIRSYLGVPITLDDRWWGFIGLDECREERVWSPAEVEALRAAAGALTAAIHDATRRGRDATSSSDIGCSSTTCRSSRTWTMPTTRFSGVYVSPPVEAMLGYSPEEWLADPGFLGMVLHRDDRQMVFGGGWPEGPGPHVNEYRLIARDGRVVWIHDQYVLVRDDDGTPLTHRGS